MFVRRKLYCDIIDTYLTVYYDNGFPIGEMYESGSGKQIIKTKMDSPFSF